LKNTQLIDQFERPVRYFRISITDRCNLQCLYCTPNELIPKLSHRDILSYEEILHLVHIGVKLGISKVRVTGGEPLVRKGVYGFLKALTSIEGLSDVSLTTNGVLIANAMESIQSAGIKRFNISLDTLKRSRYQEITGRDYFDRVWAGIMTAHEAGIHPVKLNIVALRGVNDDEILDFAKLTYSYPFHIRFIEYMPIGSTNARIGSGILTPEIKHHIESLGPLIPKNKSAFDGPAEYFQLEGAIGHIGFISPLSHHFCSRCNRIRLTASGQLRPCLLSDFEVDIKQPLRNGASDDELAAILRSAVSQKQASHQMMQTDSGRICTQMSTIGG